jgi:hypothetical protein
MHTCTCVHTHVYTHMGIHLSKALTEAVDYRWRQAVWFKWYSAYLASVRPWVQPLTTKKGLKKKREDLRVPRPFSGGRSSLLPNGAMTAGCPHARKGSWTCNSHRIKDQFKLGCGVKYKTWNFKTVRAKQEQTLGWAKPSKIGHQVSSCASKDTIKKGTREELYNGTLTRKISILMGKSFK